ncbi:hypothetical protein NAT51_03530 [Flavobacterium amniphilum]|uniref:hypothetical protein n=1 Tax=Flavobacterium amniphilum TaxID=1834035 RepID=UPI00202A9921|nr:hypothetical protein [Flavobacterium amniphilum]MCL9804577.1 hypothetical protein [Flavobacterium amniphilum]
MKNNFFMGVKVLLVGISLTFSQFLAAQNNEGKMKLLVIVNAENNLKVNLNKSPFLYGGILGVLIAQGIADEANERKSVELQKLMTDFVDYRFKHASTIKENLMNKNSMLDITAFNKRDVAKYFDAKAKLNFDQLKADGWKNVLLINEYLGYFRSDKKDNKFSVCAASEVTAYDVAKEKSLGKVEASKLKGDVLFSEEEISSQKNILIDNYAALYPGLDLNMYFRLLGKDLFNKMAITQGMEKEFPSVKNALSKYKKTFEVKFPEVDGWKKFATGNDYLFVNAPSKDKTIMAISSDVDLAIDELGQKDLDINEYVALRISRLKEANFEVDTVNEMPKLSIGNDWIAYMITHPNKGKSIIVHRKIDNFFVSHEMVLLQQDYLTLFNKYKADIESYINNSYLISKS